MDKLSRLRDLILRHLSADRGPLGGANIFFARSPQQLRAVPLHSPAAGLILNGRKELQVGTTKHTLRAGQLMFWPANCDLYFGNHPEGPNGIYLALIFAFPPRAIEHFGRHYGQQTKAWEQAPAWSADVPAPVLLAMTQWVQLCLEGPVDPEVLHHRQVELLLLMAKQGLAGNLLMARQPGWRQRVAHLLSLNPAHGWEAAEVGERLGCAESSLRRHLREEGTSFRDLLEEVRLVAGLALLQETFWSVARVAAEVGYESHSRFSDRFRSRFGMTPSELKRTRVSDSGEQMSGAGEVGMTG
jgi:AraC-like DNA-binding protein